MNWDDAMAECEALGDGWHLPTKGELNLLYLNKDAIGGFVKDYYWSSTESEHNADKAWRKDFTNGLLFAGAKDSYKTGTDTGTVRGTYYVRAVRDFNP